MAFSRGRGGSMTHWILEASNILAGMKRALHRRKALILLVFLAPRPGLEPGTYGLTVDFFGTFRDFLGFLGTI